MAIMFAVAGCVPKGGLEPDFVLNENGPSVLVFGYKQTDINLQFFRGEIVDGKFWQSAIAAGNYNGSGENGYAIFKVKPGRLLALTAYVHKNQPILKQITNPCGDLETIMLQIPNETGVFYIGDLEVGGPTEPFKLSVSDNIDAARNYFAKNYPSIADDLVQGEYTWTQKGGSCSLDVVVPIYTG